MWNTSHRLLFSTWNIFELDGLGRCVFIHSLTHCLHGIEFGVAKLVRPNSWKLRLNFASVSLDACACLCTFSTYPWKFVWNDNERNHNIRMELLRHKQHIYAHIQRPCQFAEHASVNLTTLNASNSCIYWFKFCTCVFRCFAQLNPNSGTKTQNCKSRSSAARCTHVSVRVRNQIYLLEIPFPHLIRKKRQKMHFIWIASVSFQLKLLMMIVVCVVSCFKWMFI